MVGGDNVKEDIILHADGTTWCSNPVDMEYIGYRNYHTLSGLTSCGGHEHPKRCFTLDQNYNWSSPITLRKQRREHISWSTSAGIVLMGGGASPQTTEIVNNGKSTDHFTLRNITRYTLIM